MKEVARFDLHQRVQHILMASSFVVLAVTGLPQKFDDLAVSQAFIAALGGLDSVRLAHRVAAFVMLFDCAYHVVYLFWLIVVRRRRAFGMVATPQDLRDIFHSLRWFLGLTRTKPAFDRYAYMEKFDYWAVFWGIAIIGGSGLALMFPVAVTAILPGVVIPVAFVAHSDEAVLAVGWIVFVHLFYAHLSPRVFPMDRSIFTGKTPLTVAREHHPRWVARFTEDASKGGSVAGAPADMLASSERGITP
ncbi:MAG: cytochrome b/b6 domain-containing protein [Chloroflexi bacterium]|nr:cytochrome b/b6 domain-containing protein [Chloroflexota bacterium]MBI2983050.1 cytochrome b/b6 domain-containing protein [Chloroflexota bacterium]